MKSLWLLLSVLCVANVLALLGFAGWLKMNDRLDRARVQRVRELFTKTITQEKADEAAAAAQAEADKKKTEDEAKHARPPLTASEQLATRLELSEVDRQRVALLKAEVGSLRATLARERAQLDDQRTKLEASQKQFRDEMAAAESLNQDQQFRTTLGVLEALKPTDAHATMMEMIAAAEPGSAAPAIGTPPAGPGPQFAPVQPNTPAPGATGSPTGAPPAPRATPAPVLAGKKLVAAYLDAMEDRARSKLVAEFVKSDPKLAAELLEILRTRRQPSALAVSAR